MSDKFFVDTNILVYSVADDQHKRAIAENLIGENEIIEDELKKCFSIMRC